MDCLDLDLGGHLITDPLDMDPDPQHWFWRMLKIFNSHHMGQHITQGVLPVVGLNNRQGTKAQVGGFWVFLYIYIISLWYVLASSSPLHIMSFSFMREELCSLYTVLRGAPYSQLLFFFAKQIK